MSSDMHSVDELRRAYSEVEDHLIPILHLDAHERAVYYHLFRHTRLVGIRTCRISIDGLARATGLSAQVRGHLRRLEAAGCVRVVEKNRMGTTVEVLLPAEIPGCVRATAAPPVLDFETLDCFRDERGRLAILG